MIISEDPLFLVRFVYDNEADGMVLVQCVLPQTQCAMLHCIELQGHSNSFFFAMVSPKTEYGSDGLMFLQIVQINPNPTSEQLADTISTKQIIIRYSLDKFLK